MKKEKVYGQTISINYFTNEKVKDRPYFFNGKAYKAYPLYLRISVKRQNTTIRSITGAYVAPEFLNNFLEERSHDIHNETEAIKSKILLANPFEDPDFSLNNTLNEFKVRYYDFRSIVCKYISLEYTAAIKLDYNKILAELQERLFPLTYSDKELLKDPSSEIIHSKSIQDHKESLINQHIRDLISSLSLDNNSLFDRIQIEAHMGGYPNVKKLFEKYESEFWNLNTYCEELLLQTGHITLSVNDWTQGWFDNHFIDIYKDEHKLISIHKGLHQLRQNHKALDYALKAS